MEKVDAVKIINEYVKVIKVEVKDGDLPIRLVNIFLRMSKIVEEQNRDQEIAAKGRDVAMVDPELSPRQVEVALGIARGLSNKEIAREMNIAPFTVAVHMRDVSRKMGMKNRTQVGVWVAMYAGQYFPGALQRAQH